MKIGDVVVGITGDWPAFQKTAQTEGDKAGKALGDATSKGFNVGRVAVAAFATTAAAGLALAAQGGVELQRVQSDYIAATGASTEEAKAFAAQVNGMRGSNTQSLQAIAKAGTQVAQQFKVTGDEAKTLTQNFLDFSRVTKQDASQAVDGFDKLLDAFGLPASRAVGLMDQLVASNQRFGTDAGPAAQQALADMAPALQAMGLGLDAGVGLLNLFEQSGIDAGSATMSLNKAIKSLKPGQDLDSLIAELGRIEDPLLRGQRAMEIFGKGGAKMANAIKPGMTSLADFEVAVGDVGGTMTKTADSMDTDTDRINKFLNGLRAGMSEFGTTIGPLATGLLSISTLGGPVLGSLLMMATGTTTLSAAMALLWVSLSPVIVALLAIAGVIVTVAAVSELLKDKTSEVDKTYVAGIKRRMEITRLATDELDDGTRRLALYQAAWGLAANEMLDAGHTAEEARAALQKAGWTDADIAELEARAASASGAIAMGMTPAEAELAAGAQRAATYTAQAAAAQAAAREAESQAGAAFRAGERADEDASRVAFVESKRLAAVAAAAFRDDAAKGLKEMITRIRQASQDAAVAAAMLPGKIGDAILAAASALSGSLSHLQQILKDGLTPKKAVAQALGKQIIIDLKAGIARGDPIAVGAARAVAFDAIEAIATAGMGTSGKGLKRIGELKTQLLASGLTSAEIDAVLAARHVVETASGPKGFQIDPGVYDYGSHLGGRYVQGIADQADAAASAARDVLHSATGVLRQAPGPKTDPEVFRMGDYGRHTIARWFHGIEDEGVAQAPGVAGRVIRAFSGALQALPALSMADIASSVLSPMRQSLAVSGGSTVRSDVYFHADPKLLADLRAAGYDERAVVGALVDAESELRAQRHASFLPVTADGW